MVTRMHINQCCEFGKQAKKRLDWLFCNGIIVFYHIKSELNSGFETEVQAFW